MISVCSASWKDCVSSTWAIKTRPSITSPLSSASECALMCLWFALEQHIRAWKRTIVHIVTAASIPARRRLNTTTTWCLMRYWSTACCVWSKAGETKLSNTLRQRSEWFCMASIFLLSLSCKVIVAIQFGTCLFSESLNSFQWVTKPNPWLIVTIATNICLTLSIV